MRLRLYETIYLIKEVTSNDVNIELQTFNNEKIILDIPRGKKQDAIMKSLFENGYLEVSSEELDSIYCEEINSSF